MSSSTTATATSTASTNATTTIEKTNETTPRRIGILIVGLGGANGTTLVGGVLAHRYGTTWKPSKQWDGTEEGKLRGRWDGCVTQLSPRGVHGGVGFGGSGGSRQLGMADASWARVGGWDVRPVPLGEAWSRHGVVDHDLCSQLKEEMNTTSSSATYFFKGCYHPSFVGTNQWEGATHVQWDLRYVRPSVALEGLRRDIRNFCNDGGNSSSGHTTVIWSASVEPNSFLTEQLTTAEELLQAIAMAEAHDPNDCDNDQVYHKQIPPSLLYATAALLEGCSFVNGGSQNTLSCPGLLDLATRELSYMNIGNQMIGGKIGCGMTYCLGTDFKAGQTKFKTAAVEYLRTAGLRPRVVASSNHLGNNDMYNLVASTGARQAKLRVKKDIFANWDEDICHVVSVMYTPYMGDEKRDFVEYTSTAFLSQEHTMVTYTRASDSILCVPLMIDVAVLLDYFATCRWPHRNVADATAYLFKVPEGHCDVTTLDPGFFHQMNRLREEIQKASHNSTLPITTTTTNTNTSNTGTSKQPPMTIVCAGLACLDMQLHSASASSDNDGGESIETFQGETTVGGGSVSWACRTLARLYRNGTPVVDRVVPVARVGTDDAGRKLRALLKNGNFASSTNNNTNVDVSYLVQGERTAMAVLPIFEDGRRGCFFDQGSNDTFGPEHLTILAPTTQPTQQHKEPMTHMDGFLFGYPHLLPKLQGEALATVFRQVGSTTVRCLDLNGVPPPTTTTGGGGGSGMSVILPVLPYTDILHCNLEELQRLSGMATTLTNEDKEIETACRSFLDKGVAVIALTLGAEGSYVVCHSSASRFDESPKLPRSWIGASVRMPAVAVTGPINTNGAGDSFTAALLVACLSKKSLLEAVQFASMVAARHVDISTRDLSTLDVTEEEREPKV